MAFKARITGATALSFADQAVSAATNMYLLVTVSRASPPAVFAEISLIVGGMLFVFGLVRALIYEPMLMDHRLQSSRGGPRERDLARSLAASVIIPMVTATSALIVYSVSGTLSAAFPPQAFVLLAVLFPILAVQDAARYSAFVRQRPAVALLSDSVWLAAFVVLDAVALKSGTGLLLGWAAAGATSGLFALALLHLRPRFTAGAGFLATYGRRGIGLATDFLLGQGVLYVGLWAIAARAGLDAVAALRGAQLVFGPANLTVTALLVSLVPVWAGRGCLPKRRAAVAVSGALLLIGVTVAVAWAALPARGRALVLGQTADVLAPVWILLATALTLILASAGAMLWLRATARVATIVRVRSINSAVFLTAIALLVAPSAPVRSTAAAFATYAVVQFVVWWGAVLADSGRPRKLEYVRTEFKSRPVAE